MFKYCPPPLIVLMDFLFIFLFILLYTSNTDAKLQFSLPDSFPDDFLTANKVGKIKLSCPKVYPECKHRDYIKLPSDLQDEVAKVVLSAFLPPSSCNSLKIPLTAKIDGRTWLDQKKMMKQNECLKNKENK